MSLGRHGAVLLAQRANVDRYPPVLHQARLLAPMYEVTIIDRVSAEEGDEAPLPPIVRRRRVYASVGRGRLAGVMRVAEMYRFRHQIAREWRVHPHVAIAYDAESAATILRQPQSSRSAMRIIHLHELIETGHAGVITRRAAKYLMDNLKRSDLVVVPDADRARIVKAMYGLTTSPMVVMNCPPRIATLPESRLVPRLREFGISDRRIVHYQGAVGPDHCLEAIIASMQYWPADAVFVVVGDGPDDYRERLHSIAMSAGLGERVCLLGRVKYDEVLAFAMGAHVGLTLLEPTIDNQRYCAGASNKRFEYAALGIPQVTNTGAGMEEVFGGPGLATLIDTQDAPSIGRAVAALLEDPAFAGRMGQAARAAHLRTNNYEMQFAPVQRVIESWLHRPR